GVFWDPGRDYSVPWQWGTTGIAVDTAVYSGAGDTLRLIFDPPPELQGKIVVVDDLAIIYGALQYLSKPRCIKDAQDFKILTDLLRDAKQHWRAIAYDNADAMISGELAVAYIWNGQALRARRERQSGEVLNLLGIRRGASFAS